MIFFISSKPPEEDTKKVYCIILGIKIAWTRENLWVGELAVLEKHSGIFCGINIKLTITWGARFFKKPLNGVEKQSSQE